jgi:hypothetical protein
MFDQGRSFQARHRDGTIPIEDDNGRRYSMRSIVFLFALLIGALSQVALAQQPLLRAAAKHVPMPTFDLVDYKLQCPAGYVPTNYSHTPQYPYDINEDQFRLFTNAGGAEVDKSAVADASQLMGGG